MGISSRTLFIALLLFPVSCACRKGDQLGKAPLSGTITREQYESLAKETLAAQVRRTFGPPAEEYPLPGGGAMLVYYLPPQHENRYLGTTARLYFGSEGALYAKHLATK